MEGAVAKSFRLLEALVAAGGRSRLSALAADVGMQKSTVHRVLGELVALGYATQDPATGLYGPTLRTWELGTAIVADLPLKQAAGTALQDLHRRTSETVSLTVRSGDDVLYLDKIVSPRPVRFTTRVGSRVPAVLTAGGRAILAHADDASHALERLARRPGPTAGLDLGRALRDLDDIRRRGYAVSTLRSGVESVAAAVIDRDDKPVGALTVSAPTERLTDARRADIVEALLATSTTLAESVGRL